MIKRFFHYIKNTYKIISDAVLEYNQMEIEEISEKNRKYWEGVESRIKDKCVGCFSKLLPENNNNFSKRINSWIEDKSEGNLFSSLLFLLLIIICLLFPLIFDHIQHFFTKKPLIFNEFTQFIPVFICTFAPLFQSFLVTCPPDLKKQAFPCKIVPIFFIFCICTILWLPKLFLWLPKLFLWLPKSLYSSKSLLKLSFILAVFVHPVLKDAIYWFLGCIEYSYWKFGEFSDFGIFLILCLFIFFVTELLFFISNNYTKECKDFLYQYSLSNKLLIFSYMVSLSFSYILIINKKYEIEYDINKKIARNIANEQIVKITEEVSEEMEKDDALQDQIIIKKAVKLIEEVPQKENKDSEKSVYKGNINLLDFIMFLSTIMYMQVCLHFLAVKKT